MATLFAKSNRGLLMDMFVFGMNMLLMHWLTIQLKHLLPGLSNGTPNANLTLGIALVATWILPVAAVFMKRWHFHQRRRSRRVGPIAENTGLSGCLFNPIIFFCINIIITSAIIASLGTFVFGDQLRNGNVFVPLVFGGMILTIVQTYFVYRYFTPPKTPPRSAFLRSPYSDTVGDICLFVNMLFFQVIWNLLTSAPLAHPTGVGDFVGRLFFLTFIALLCYFPPRMFYLAEDINRPRTWVTMTLANSPVIARILIGNSPDTAVWN